MERNVKIDNKKYYKVKANESKYMLFKSRDDFKKIEELEKMVFDLVRFAISGKDKKETILSRMKSIEKYLKTLNSTKVEVFFFMKIVIVMVMNQNLIIMTMHLTSSFHL